MSYISNLNLLNTDLPVTIDEKALQDELALWANAKFNFDTTTPDSSSSVLHEAGAEKQQQSASFHNSEYTNDSDLLETLTKLTEFVQPAQQQEQQQQQLIQPAPSSLPFFHQQDFLLHTPANNVLFNASIASPAVHVTAPVMALASSTSAPVSQTHHQLPRIAPAPGPVSGIQMLEAASLVKRNSTSENNHTVSTASNKKRPHDAQDDSDLNAEDDKRRRNTAASARFRLKKKMREQALEKQSKEMASHVEQLEAKVKELEMEAKWLRALVVEKDPGLLANSADSASKSTAEQ